MPLAVPDPDLCPDAEVLIQAVLTPAASRERWLRPVLTVDDGDDQRDEHRHREVGDDATEQTRSRTPVESPAQTSDTPEPIIQPVLVEALKNASKRLACRTFSASYALSHLFDNRFEGTRVREENDVIVGFEYCLTTWSDMFTVP